MLNRIARNVKYIARLTEFIRETYGISAHALLPARRGYYGETWRADAAGGSYFLKLDYIPRHKEIFKNSLHVMEYLCDEGIDFISKIVKTSGGGLYSIFDSAVLGAFEWIDGENVETDETKIPEYQMLGKIYALSKPGFNIPTITFSSETVDRVFRLWDLYKSSQSRDSYKAVLALLAKHEGVINRSAARLKHFAERCHADASHFYITHGDAGGNFVVGRERNYFVDWDEVMYAPPERDAWVMGCYEWARKLFNESLSQNGIQYELRPERLAFFCCHMFLFYLGEFLEDYPMHFDCGGMADFMNDGWIWERIAYTDAVYDDMYI